jgi:hypothetical protein
MRYEAACSNLHFGQAKQNGLGLALRGIDNHPDGQRFDGDLLESLELGQNANFGSTAS